MEILEKAAYLKGLAEGLGVDDSTKEGKLLLAVLDLLGDIAENVDALETDLDLMVDQLESIDEDLDVLAEDCGCDCGHDHGHHHGHHHPEGFEDYEGDIYQVTCPSCGEDIYLDEEMLDDGELPCPKCGEKLELDFEGSIEDGETE